MFVLAQEGDAEHGVIIGRAFSDAQRTPAAPGGELLARSSKRRFLKLQNDGTVQVNGDLHVAGDVYDRKGSLDRLRQHYDVHTHASGPAAMPQD